MKAYTATLRLRIMAHTRTEARTKILSHFPGSRWPKGSVSILEITDADWFNQPPSSHIIYSVNPRQVERAVLDRRGVVAVAESHGRTRTSWLRRATARRRRRPE